MAVIGQISASSINPYVITAYTRADCKGGVCIGSVDYYQFVVWHRMGD